MDKPGLFRLLRYSLVGAATFSFDLVILYVLTKLGIGYLVAVTGGFVAGVSVNYAISRPWVFKRTERSYRGGYIHFVAVGATALTVILLLTGILVSVFGIPLFPARIAVGIFVGFCGYLYNLYVNFNVAGKH